MKRLLNNAGRRIGSTTSPRSCTGDLPSPGGVASTVAGFRRNLTSLHMSDGKIGNQQTSDQDDDGNYCGGEPSQEFTTDAHSLATPLSPLRVGSKTLKVEPCPTSESTQMRPLCASTRVFAMESPTPVSPTPSINGLSARYRREKTRGKSSLGIPPPWSTIWIKTYS